MRPNKKYEDPWSAPTKENNSRKLRILSGETEGLKAASWDGLHWNQVEGRDEYPDRLLGYTSGEVEGFCEGLGIDRDWTEETERGFLLSFRNHMLAQDKEDVAKAIWNPRLKDEGAREDSTQEIKCPRCKSIPPATASYYQSCSLRMSDGRPKSYKIFQGIVPEDDLLIEMYENDIPPSHYSEIAPTYYTHVKNVFLTALLDRAKPDSFHEELPFEPDEITDEKTKSWLIAYLGDLQEEQIETHPIRRLKD